jgi:hypothetical protein
MAFLATGIFILQQEIHFILTGSKNKIALTRNSKLAQAHGLCGLSSCDVDARTGALIEGEKMTCYMKNIFPFGNVICFVI